MVIVQQETEPKLKTPAQEALMHKLMQSKVFSKSEYTMFHRKLLVQIVTSYDASIFLNYLLAAVRFRKMFTGRHARAHAKCSYCGSRDELVRCYNIPEDKQIYFCKTCYNNTQSENVVMQPSEFKHD